MSPPAPHSEPVKTKYYVPGPSYWPIIGSIALLSFFIGLGNWIHGNTIGPYLFFFGFALLVFMMYGWFGVVIHENRAGLLHHPRIERSFRLGMLWFIFTEVMFFGAFFAVLFYVRYSVLPELGGAGSVTHQLLWPHFKASWPVYNPPNPSLFHGPKSVMEAWGIPALNTLILLSSAATVTIAHWGLIKNRRRQMILFQALTIILGIIFLMMQAHEYLIAYNLKSLTLSSGIYGSTFFMLTGFHALHVSLGTVMLGVILYRMLRGDFSTTDYFGFEAVSWYWHFVDVVWLALFIFVYWM